MVSRFLACFIVTYAYIFFSYLSSMPYGTPSVMYECSPTIKSTASVLYLCPIIIHARSLD